jgi:hypothetical protein
MVVTNICHYCGLDGRNGHKADCPLQAAQQLAMLGTAPGVKLDTGKVDTARWVVAYFPDALDEVARVSEAGAVKYCEGGWRLVADGVRRYTAATYRHLRDVLKGEKFDADPAFAGKKIRHRAQVVWNGLAALQLELKDENNA